MAKSLEHTRNFCAESKQQTAGSLRTAPRTVQPPKRCPLWQCPLWEGAIMVSYEVEFRHRDGTWVSASPAVAMPLQGKATREAPLPCWTWDRKDPGSRGILHAPAPANPDREHSEGSKSTQIFRGVGRNLWNRSLLLCTCLNLGHPNTPATAPISSRHLDTLPHSGATNRHQSVPSHGGCRVVKPRLPTGILFGRPPRPWSPSPIEIPSPLSHENNPMQTPVL